MRWQPYSLDYKTAFLECTLLDRPLFVLPPKEANCPENVVWQLRKPVYGLKDASKKWFLRVKEVLESLSFKMCPFEPALFVNMKEDSVVGIVMLHVDDILYGDTDSFVTWFKLRVESAFTIGKEFACPLKFTGIEIIYDAKRTTFTLDQSKFIESIEFIDESIFRNKNEILSEHELSEFRRLIGQLQWVASQTRPEISFYANSLAGGIKNADFDRVKSANKRLRMLKYTLNMKLSFPQLSGINNVIMELFFDASFQILPNGGS